MSAIEEKVRIQLLLENLLIAKSRNNKGSTAEDELESVDNKLQLRGAPNVYFL
jgi:hypothetical protein